MQPGRLFPESRPSFTFRETHLRIAFIAAAIVAAAPLAHADGNADHPAIAARRVIASQGYDYASKFYLHPAGLRLTAGAAAATTQPAALVAGPQAVEQRPAARSVRRR